MNTLKSWSACSLDSRHVLIFVPPLAVPGDMFVYLTTLAALALELTHKLWNAEEGRAGVIQHTINAFQLQLNSSLVLLWVAIPKNQCCAFMWKRLSFIISENMSYWKCVNPPLNSRQSTLDRWVYHSCYHPTPLFLYSSSSIFIYSFIPLFLYF